MTGLDLPGDLPADLRGKRVLVTGASRGVGLGIARGFARAGAELTILATGESVRRAAEALAEDCGREVRAIICDITDRAAVAREVGGLGALDVLVNNAGTTSFIPHAQLEDVSIDDWNRILSVNLVGPFQCARAASELLRAGEGGEVVMTSSIAGIAGVGSSIPYCASKAALNNLTLALAHTLAPDIRVNAIAPVAWTPAMDTATAANPTLEARLVGRTPPGRIGDPTDDIGPVAVFLASPLSRHMTGQTLAVDGGLTVGTANSIPPLFRKHSPMIRERGKRGV